MKIGAIVPFELFVACVPMHMEFAWLVDFDFVESLLLLDLSEWQQLVEHFLFRKHP